MLASNYLVESRAVEALISPALYSVIPKSERNVQRRLNPVEKSFAIARVTLAAGSQYVKNDRR